MRKLSVLRNITFGVGTLVVLGCSSDPSAPALDMSKELWSVTLNHKRITMSSVVPYNTIQLVAVARNSRGEPMTEPKIQFRTGDESIRVDSTGLITALQSQSNLSVIVTAKYGNVTVKDTAIITITDQADLPTQARVALSLDPWETPEIYPGLTGGSSRQFYASVVDGENNPIPEALIHIRSSDTLRMAIDESGYGLLTNDRSPGTFKVYAEGTVYGIPVKDSMLMTIGDASDAFVGVNLKIGPDGRTLVGVFVPDSINLHVGGGVIWMNASAQDIDITFDNPSEAEEWMFFPMGSGNIEPFKVDSSGSEESMMRTRAFSRPGLHIYRSKKYGTVGKIFVR